MAQTLRALPGGMFGAVMGLAGLGLVMRPAVTMFRLPSWVSELWVVLGIETFTIRNRLGLHARAAALLVKTANRFAADLTIEKDGVEVNGKSIMGILMLAASKGTKITLKAEGKDANQAMQTLGKLIEDKFGEE